MIDFDKIPAGERAVIEAALRLVVGIPEYKLTEELAKQMFCDGRLRFWVNDHGRITWARHWYGDKEIRSTVVYPYWSHGWERPGDLKKPVRKNISARNRFFVFRRDNFVCQYCGFKAPGVELDLLVIDHKVPVANGGTDDRDNLVTACKTCNDGKSNIQLLG